MERARVKWTAFSLTPIREPRDAGQSVAVDYGPLLALGQRRTAPGRDGEAQREFASSSLLAPRQDADWQNLRRQVPHRGRTRRDRQGLPALYEVLLAVRLPQRAVAAHPLPRHARPRRARLRPQRGP